MNTAEHIDVIHEAADVAQELTRLAENIHRAGARGHARAIEALADRLTRVLDAHERGHRVPPSTAGKRILAVLAEQGDRHPTPAHLVGLAVEAGIADSVTAMKEIDLLWNAGWVEAFEVDEITFLALEGERPKLEDLPKAGDEIELVSGEGSAA
jgi:hypothetical protein